MIEPAILKQIDPEKIYGVSGIARLTGIHPNTIRKDLNLGNLVGKKGAFNFWWKVKGTDLIEYLEKR